MLSKEDLKSYIHDAAVKAFSEIRDYRDGNPLVCQRILLDLTTGRGEGAALSQPLEIAWPLDSIFVEDATDINTSINVSFIDGASHQVQNYKSLYKRDGMEFDRKIPKIVLTWTAQSSKTLTLLLFSGVKFKSGNLTVINSGGVSITTGDTLSQTNPAPTTTATLLKAANTSRKEIVIQNQGGVAIWIGGSGVTATGATRGILLDAGGIISLNTTAALYGITLAGTADIHVSEES